MPKAKNKFKNKFFRIVHLQTVVFLVIYFLITNFVFVNSVAHPNIYLSFFVPLAFGTLSSFIFLYLFSHKDFFHFMGSFEKEEEAREQKYLNKFGKYGKLLACILIAWIAGPIFLSLSVRFLFFDSKYKYVITFVSTLILTIIVVAFAKGFIRLVF